MSLKEKTNKITSFFKPRTNTDKEKTNEEGDKRNIENSSIIQTLRLNIQCKLILCLNLSWDHNSASAVSLSLISVNVSVILNQLVNSVCKLI